MSIYNFQSDANSIGTVANDDTGTPLRTMVDRLTQDITALKAALSPDDAGGIYLGGSIAENLLDDYEEGSFTPTLQDDTLSDAEGQTYSNQVGRYTKIGDLVNCYIDLGMLSLGSLTPGNQMRIAGLPFIPIAGGIFYPLTIHPFSGMAKTIGQGITGYVNSNSGNIIFFKDASTTGGSSFLISELTLTGRIGLSFQYKT